MSCRSQRSNAGINNSDRFLEFVEPSSSSKSESDAKLVHHSNENGSQNRRNKKLQSGYYVSIRKYTNLHYGYSREETRIDKIVAEEDSVDPSNPMLSGYFLEGFDITITKYVNHDKGTLVDVPISERVSHPYEGSN